MRAIGTGVITAISLLGLLGIAPGCGGQVGTVCDLICECEHCNDYEEELTCIDIQTTQDVAEAYECGAEWEAYATCFEEKGKCDEKEADFSTQEAGSCSGLQSIDFPCANGQADCDMIGTGYICDNGQCAQRVCAGNNPFPCTADGDCAGGEDRCDGPLEDLAECQDKASAHPGFQQPRN